MLIALYRSGEFWQPVLLPGGGSAGARASSMAVPEAAVDEDDGVVLGEYQVRTSGEVAAVQAKAKAKAMQKGAYLEFRCSVTGTNSAHDRCPFLW